MPAGRSDGIGGIENYFSILNIFMTMDGGASICRRTWLFSKTQPPIRRKIIPLASRNKRVIFALQLGDDMAECK
jgi:hypothetical protein